MKNPFLKRLMKDTKETVVHSSAYAKAQNAGGIGTASTESFGERMKIDRNRTVVRRYGESRVVNDAQGGGLIPKTYNRAEDKAFDVKSSEVKKQAFGTGSKTKIAGKSAYNNPGAMRKNPWDF